MEKMGQKNFNRLENLSRLQQETFDVLVVGGGATGAGIALEAVSRGYKTALVEGVDYSKATSSKSTKILHGGVRYLAQSNIKLVKEALEERQYIIANAPHLSRQMDYIIPCYSYFDKYYYGLGLSVYNFASGKFSLGKTRLLSVQQTLELYPNIEQKGLLGGVLYTDGLFDDARLNLETIMTASHLGAICVNYVKVDALIKEQEKIAGAKAHDFMSGHSFEIRAKTIVNACGVMVDVLRQDDDAKAGCRVIASQGAHIVLPKKYAGGLNALMIPKTKDGRVCFAIPWYDHLLVGTTDVAVKPSLEPIVMEEEIDFIIETFKAFSAIEIKKEEILSIWAGLRPLVSTKAVASANDISTKKLARDHVVEISSSGLTSVMGGKWTTFRLMGEDAINQMISNGLLPAKEESSTRTLKFIGFREGKILDGGKLNFLGAFAEQLNCYENGSEKIVPHLPFVWGCVGLAVENEMAQTLEDVLCRRLRMLFVDARTALEVAPKVAQYMASLLNKDKDWIQTQLAQFEQNAKNWVPKV